MTNIVLEGPIVQIREREVKLLFDLAERIATFGGDAPEDKSRLLQSANDLRDMFFLVVVVGEFNAGKSTFINALLGDELLPMGITPTTEVIELIRYSDRKSKEPKLREQDSIREWTHPNTGAPGVAIVDSPGTGSVFAKHERIAKGFLSRSDLVIFVMSAKRAFAQTERLYLELARDYGKKVILVINQVDLLDKKDLKEVVSFVKQQISELVNLDPPIFTVSAKKALQGKRGGGLFSGGGSDDTGMNNLQDYLRDTFTRVPPAKQKLVAQVDFADSIMRKYQGKVGEKLSLIGADRQYAEQLRAELEKQAELLAEQLNTTMRELDRIFDTLLNRGRDFVNKHLTLGRSLRPPDREAMRQKFEKEVIGTSLDQISRLSEDYVSAVVDSSRRYWRSIIDRLNKLEALIEQEVGGVDAASYADQRAALQQAIAIADTELKTYTEDNLAESLRDTFATNMFGFTASVTGLLGGIAAIIVGSAAPGAITATVVGVLGAMVVGPVMAVGGMGGVLLYGRKLRHDAIDELETRLEKLRDSYRQSLVDMTDRERARLLQYGQQILSPVFSHLEVIAKKYQDQKGALEELQKVSADLHREIDALQVTIEY
ncbi:MAG: hypothetical protein DPW16_05105 [Chloroflexi bacterium]|nr:hypothetical protein [Chloroflexota bacterium]